MNLFDMARRKDRNLVLREAASAVKQPMDGASWMGFEIVSSDAPQLIIRNATQWYPLRERPDHCGWYLTSTQGKESVLEAWFASPDDPAKPIWPKSKLRVSSGVHPVLLPWGLAPVNGRPLDLFLQFRGAPGQIAFLAVHRLLDRKPLIALARGQGVEIGPGHHPQILPTPETAVSYIEQKHPEDWARFYDKSGKYELDPALWDHYTVGEAHALPCQDESLDFIFSSHVFEHLANPVGHLQHWHKKLRPGGVVLAIVPDVAGSKDYVAAPCSLESILAEDSFEPTLSQYERYIRYRNMPYDPATFMAEGRSIHVHFYTARNMSALLEHAVARLGFSSYAVRHHANNKDFHFVLMR